MERYRTTLILVAVLVVLAILAIMLNNNNNATTSVPTPTPSVYVWQDTNPVIGLDIMSGTQKVSMSKDLSTTVWVLTAPIQGDADPVAAGNEASSLQNLQATSVITSPSDLSQFGLARQGMTVTLTFSDTKRTQRILLVGNPTFDGSNYYVKVKDGKDVYAVSNTTIEPLRTWLTTPPKAQPSPTPLQVTVLPTATSTATPATPPPSATPTTGTTATPAVGVTTLPVAASPTAAPTASPAATP